MSNGQIVVRDVVLDDAIRVYGDDIFKILELKKAEGFEIVFVDEFGRPYPGLNPKDLRGF